MANFRLDGNVALVTGGGGVLGAHFAHTLGKAGAHVAIAGRRLEPLEKVAGELRKQGISALPVTMDVTQESSVAEAFSTIEDTFGSVDVIINNAGVAITKTAITLSLNEWQQVVDTNLKGGWIICSEAARRLVAAGKPGAIVNITSILGHRVGGAVLAYTTAKAGMEQMTRALALEWARYGIRVNALAPGYVETDLNRDFFATDSGKAMIQRIPQRRLGSPEDLEGALLLLASNASSYMTGSSIVVDGGHLHSTL
ncbi:SDR family oxidoreductase [Candidimonas sp. SYP-B2681]|uniref:SDR family NAD(P)-dependent oxidoreductase n=1 Tax=Candidimonas sp. SYP-B2681 TaxID=2497686 RepID=UPI000F872110|nr:SDR family oxidoreductase [Candidimonas sp. SYP-B2681]RTZ44624.1 SDR family oxidoreductase [Candidimonas sp. SYP-B2681]